MAVSTVVRQQLSARRRLFVPPGLQPWRALGTSTGDSSGGEVSFFLDLNPDSNPTSESFAITQVEIAHGGSSALKFRIYMEQADFEEPGAQNPRFGETVQGSAGTDWGGTVVEPTEPLVLGPVKANKKGRFGVYFSANTNSVGYAIMFRGWWSKTAFACPTTVIP